MIDTANRLTSKATGNTAAGFNLFIIVFIIDFLPYSISTSSEDVKSSQKDAQPVLYLISGSELALVELPSSAASLLAPGGAHRRVLP